MKRLFDVTLAFFGLMVALPLMATIAIAIKLGDGDPVVFSQVRIGRFGRRFRMHKFRTMVVGADKNTIPLTVHNDSRITPLGKRLRRTKLDELPQLVNVLKGEMSLVGPRPEVPRFVEHYTAEQRHVLAVRPGMTDPASLQYFEEAAMLDGAMDPEMTYIEHVMPRKLAINLDYMRRSSLARDMRILLRTLWRVARSFKRQVSRQSREPVRRAA